MHVFYLKVNSPKLYLGKRETKKPEPINVRAEVYKKMAPRVGLEPTTTRLTAGCSTIELPRSVKAIIQLTIFIITQVAGVSQQ